MTLIATLGAMRASLPSQRILLTYAICMLGIALSIDVFAAPAAATYDFTTAQTTLPTDLTTMITNAATILKLGAGAAVGLAILRGGMFFVTGLARSILSAAG